MSQDIRLVNLIKKYGSFTAISNISLDIRNSEFFTLLGPSGCGKTTLLRMIAGFNSIENGEIYFGETKINTIPAHRRNIGMVFQDYAIFPHLTVEENIRYGLKRHHVPKKEADQRVEEILRLTRIDEYRKRLPENLSGGQQQRVALARAIVIHPTVLLMDEPLSNLDAKLRVEMRSVIREIQSEIGITTIYVTHDQEEALAISDRIAVINKGEIQQVAKPRELYSRPYNLFVEGFIGRSNTFVATLCPESSNGLVRFGNDYSITISDYENDKSTSKAIVAIRPEEFFISNEGLTAVVKKVTFLGKHISYQLKFDENCYAIDQDDEFEFSQDLGSATQFFSEGDDITLGVRAEKVNLFNAETYVSMIKGVKQYA